MILRCLLAGTYVATGKKIAESFVLSAFLFTPRATLGRDDKGDGVPLCLGDFTHF